MKKLFFALGVFAFFQATGQQKPLFNADDYVKELRKKQAEKKLFNLPLPNSPSTTYDHDFYILGRDIKITDPFIIRVDINDFTLMPNPGRDYYYYFRYRNNTRGSNDLPRKVNIWGQ